MKKPFNKKIIFPITILIIVISIIGVQIVLGNKDNKQRKDKEKIKILSEEFRTSKKKKTSLDKEILEDKEKKLPSLKEQKEIENSEKEELEKNLLEEKPIEKKPNIDTKKEEKIVKISVTCLDNTIITQKDIPIEEGQTVFEVLRNITNKENVHMDFSGIGSNIYVKGIGNIYEFDKGPESGWMYRVNGVFPNKSCGGVKVNPGDVIEWLYTKNLGKDIGNGY